MTRPILAALALAVLAVIAVPAIAAGIPGEVDLKSPDGAPKLFDSLNSNNGGE